MLFSDLEASINRIISRPTRWKMENFIIVGLVDVHLKPLKSFVFQNRNGNNVWLALLAPKNSIKLTHDWRLQSYKIKQICVWACVWFSYFFRYLCKVYAKFKIDIIWCIYKKADTIHTRFQIIFFLFCWATLDCDAFIWPSISSKLEISFSENFH